MFFRPTSHESCIHGLGMKHVIVFLFFHKFVVCSCSFHFVPSFFLNQQRQISKLRVTAGRSRGQGSNPQNSIIKAIYTHDCL